MYQSSSLLLLLLLRLLLSVTALSVSIYLAKLSCSSKVAAYVHHGRNQLTKRERSSKGMREVRCSMCGQCGKLQLKVKTGSRLSKVTLPRKICVHMYEETEVNPTVSTGVELQRNITKISECHFLEEENMSVFIRGKTVNVQAGLTGMTRMPEISKVEAVLSTIHGLELKLTRKRRSNMIWMFLLHDSSRRRKKKVTGGLDNHFRSLPTELF